MISSDLPSPYVSAVSTNVPPASAPQSAIVHGSTYAPSAVAPGQQESGSTSRHAVFAVPGTGALRRPAGIPGLRPDGRGSAAPAANEGADDRGDGDQAEDSGTAARGRTPGGRLLAPRSRGRPGPVARDTGQRYLRIFCM